jgi:hypothetical protein
MKRELLRTIVLFAAILAIATLSQQRAFAQGQVNEAQKSNDQGLVGSWNVEVTIRDCQTGTPFFSFPAIITYDQGGTMHESDLGAPFLIRLAGQGVWSHDRDRQYSGAFRWLNFLPDRTFAGTSVVRSIIKLDPGSDGYTSTDRTEVLDGAGNVIPGAGACGTQTATRFK